MTRPAALGVRSTVRLKAGEKKATLSALGSALMTGELCVTTKGDESAARQRLRLEETRNQQVEFGGRPVAPFMLG